MATAVQIILFLVLSYKLVHLFSKKTTGVEVAFFLVVLSCFYLIRGLSDLMIILVTILLITQTKKVPHHSICRAYILFLFYSFFNFLFLSEGYYYGMMMLYKLSLPLLFLLCGYNLISCREDYISLLKRICQLIPLVAVLSSYPISLLQQYISPVFKSWCAGDAELFCILFIIPISYYIITNNKNILYRCLYCCLPSLTMIRRTVLGAQVLSSAVYVTYKTGFRAVFIVTILSIIVFLSVIRIPQFSTRLFGDNADLVKELSVTDFVEISKYIDTSGRTAAWDLVTDMFYKNNEVWGCGLGTMKTFLRSGQDQDMKEFEMLHNDHLHLKIELGKVGYTFFIIFFIVSVLSYIKDLRTIKHDSIIIASSIASLSMTICVFFCMFFSNMLSQVYEICMCFMFIGIHLRLKRMTYYAPSNLTTKLL